MVCTYRCRLDAPAPAKHSFSFAPLFGVWCRMTVAASNFDSVRRTFRSVVGVVISGKNLQLDAGDTLYVYDCDGDEPVLKEAYRYEDFGNLGFMDNATNITIPEGILGELELGVKAGFKVVRTITVEGVETSIESKLHVATKYEG